jgi:peptidoglycan hydrolase-like protein with peptidoglycan-binding domain
VPPGGAGAPGGIPGMEPVPPGGGAGPTGMRPTLRRGSTGDAVGEAQGLLVRHGATITPDGQFGPATQRAVVDFQRSAGLTPDGIVGPRTWKALEAG